MVDLNYLLVLMFAACRLFGVIALNPIFGRQNIPSVVKVGLALGLALFTASGLEGVTVVGYSGVEMMVTLVKEFAVGFVLGFVMTLFFAVFHFGGQLIDYQMGLAMASMYDPTTNSNVSITGNLMTIFYSMLFFVTNSHMNLMAVAQKSYDVAPLGFERVNGEISMYVIELFAYVLIYGVQLALPWIVTIMVVEVAVGIMMKVVPNINVFVVNIQMKVICGMVILLTIVPVLTRFMTQINGIMMQRLDEAIGRLAL
ncbi:MAG: flagellar biosynthetic protein FliR [Clostridiales Family XIII bacterium]|jgi:flagellar biosynthetic protein FliR|nr:flagellar biosynthetic protein FliR [Clostridiales Family XIII bacterium]